MICGLCSYAYDCNPVNVLANQQDFQERFAYCADTMVRGHYPSYARRIWRKWGRELEVSDEDAADLERGKSDFLPSRTTARAW